MGEYYRVAALRQRGWSPAMIQALLGPPDRLVPNPAFRSAAPMRLYEVERVVLAEGSDEFAVLRERAERRSRAALLAAERRRGETVASVERLPIAVPTLDWHMLAREAVAHWNRRDEERARRLPDHVLTPAHVADVDELTLQRWVVNYLRHELTGYEAALDELFGRVGRVQGTRRLRRRIYAAIAEAYPTLAEECQRQLAWRGDDASSDVRPSSFSDCPGAAAVTRGYSKLYASSKLVEALPAPDRANRPANPLLGRPMSILADKTIAALRTNHDDLVAFTRDLDAEDLVRTSGASEWTVAQVFSHLGSGAEIGLATLRAALDGQDAPDGEFNQSVWARWNGKSPKEQADDFLSANAELVAAFEGLDADARTHLRIKLGFLPAPADVTLVAGLRLSEVTLHRWDAEVAVDPGATVAADAAEVLVDLYVGPLGFLLGFLGKGKALDGRKATLRVETSEPSRTFGLVLGESVSLGETPEAADGVLAVPAEAWPRLLSGRLDASHTPSSVTLTGDVVSLDDLRRVFPGF